MTMDTISHGIVLKYKTQAMIQENGMTKFAHFSQTLSVKNLAKVQLKVRF